MFLPFLKLPGKILPKTLSILEFDSIYRFDSLNLLKYKEHSP